MTASPHTLIFHHIPKAAGSTLTSILNRRYPREQRYRMQGDGGVREERFRRLPLETRAQIRLITGHLYFGIHRHVPNPSVYVTVLRDPVERIVSHYHYVRRSPRHYLHEQVASNNMSLEDYVKARLSLELNNGQVRSLYGLEHMNVAYGDCSSGMLDAALGHLSDHYAVVGLAERFDETLLLIRRRFGWSSLPLYVSRNVTRNRPASSAIPGRVIDLIEQDNQLDILLYRTVAENFAGLAERLELGPDLRRFHLLNRFYGCYQEAADVARGALHRIRADAVAAQ